MNDATYPFPPDLKREPVGAIPGAIYRQGDRTMFAGAMPLTSLATYVKKPNPWDFSNKKASETPGNRIRDPRHVREIKEYLLEQATRSWILGSLIIYFDPENVDFQPGYDHRQETHSYGTLTWDGQERGDIGDGQHRGEGILECLHELEMLKNQGDLQASKALEELKGSSIPVVIVTDSKMVRRMQDYGDLQKNVKPPAQSLADSLDQRQPFNRLIHELVQGDEGLFRHPFVNYQTDAAGGKNANYLWPFKTVRYATQIALFGDIRSKHSLDEQCNDLAKTDPDEVRRVFAAFWSNTYGANPPIKSLVEGTGETVPRIRTGTYLVSAGVIYAMAYAFNQNEAEAISRIPALDFRRPGAFDPAGEFKPARPPYSTADTILAGSIVDKETGKFAQARESWMAAGMSFLR